MTGRESDGSLEEYEFERMGGGYVVGYEVGLIPCGLQVPGARGKFLKRGIRTRRFQWSLIQRDRAGVGKCLGGSALLDRKPRGKTGSNSFRLP